MQATATNVTNIFCGIPKYSTKNINIAPVKKAVSNAPSPSMRKIFLELMCITNSIRVHKNR
jgi:hypothetical protein